MKKTALLFILLLIVSSSIFTSCKKESPILPPENTFLISDLDSTSQKFASEGIASNWFYAAADVTIWTTIIKIGLAIPVTAYTEALNNVPSHVSGDKWVWEYSVTVFLSTYNIKLYGTFNESNGVDWEMYISQVGGYEDFLWFTGTQNAEGTEGQWILYKNPTENHELLQIDWTRNIADETGTIKYTNIEVGSTENGGYISYGNNQTGDYDAFYDIYNKGLDNLTEIDYNTEFHNGRIKDYNVFSDLIWHCWDEQLLNVDCVITK